MNMLSGLFNKEQMVFDTIQDTLQNVSEELGCSHKELFVKIIPGNEEFEPVFQVFHTKPYDSVDKTPAFRYVRDITIKEILGDE